MSQSNLSIYIPRVNASITRNQVITEFEKFGIGQVNRVDFTPINKKPGFAEDISKTGFFEYDVDDVKSIFVHFDYYYENELTDRIVSKLDNGESHRIYPACAISRQEYWILTKCTNPVQDTMMNTAQIVENCRFLENKVAEQSATIAKLEKGLDGVQSLVYQLLGGLFNQETQSEMLNIHLATLYGDTPPDVDHDEIIWPTTRQGDECQERIMKLESQLEMLNFTADPNVFDSIACARYSPNTSRMNISEFDDDDVTPQEAPQEDYSYDGCISLSGECVSVMSVSELAIENDADSYDYEASLCSQFANLSIVIPEETCDFDQNIDELHKPMSKSSSSSTMSVGWSSDSEDEYEMDCDNSLSTHSSMTELISYTDSDDESLSRRRRMVSQELCGNE